MTPLMLALAGLALLDSANVLNIGVVSAVAYDSRLGRRSPIPGGLSYIAGVFAILTTFGLCVVLGMHLLTDLVDFEMTPALRFRGELLLGLVLIGLAYVPLTAQTSAPGWALTAMRQRPWLLGFAGLAVGAGQAPTAVPYLTALAMITALDPLPPMWPLIVIAYCTTVLLPSLLILGLSTKRTKRAQRIQRRLVRGITRYGPPAVRLLFLVAGGTLVADALIHYDALW